MSLTIMPQPKEIKIKDSKRGVPGIKELEIDAGFNRRIANYAADITGPAGRTLLIAKNPALTRIDEYCLEFQPDKIKLSAGSDQGAFYGLVTLKQLRKSGQMPVSGKIVDWADIKMRIQHIDLKRIGWNFDYLRALPGRLAELKINYVLVEYEDKFSFDFCGNIPVVSAFTKKQLREFDRIARENFVEIIPLVQCIGHFEYILKHDKYAELRENPRNCSQACPLHPGTLELFKKMAGEVMEMHPDSKYFHVGADEPFLLGTCPKCAAAAREQGKGTLYTAYLNQVLGWVKDTRAKVPLFWADIILAHDDAAKTCRKDVIAVDWNYQPLAPRGQSIKAHKTRTGKIDADIYRNELSAAEHRRLDKYLAYDPERRDFYSLPCGPLLRDMGFEVISASHVSQVDNVLTHSEAVRRNSLAGQVATYWASADSVRPPYSIFETRWPGFAMLGASAWNYEYEAKRRDSFYRRTSVSLNGNEEFAGVYETLDNSNTLISPNDNNRNGEEYFKLLKTALAASYTRLNQHQKINLDFMEKIGHEKELDDFKKRELSAPLLPEKAFQKIDLAPWANEKFSNTEEKPGWSRIYNNDLRDFPQGEVCFMGIPFRILEEGPKGNPTVIMAGNYQRLPHFRGEARGIRIESRAAALHLVHGQIEGKQNPDGYYGKYVINYKGGAKEEIPLYYNRNMGAWWHILDVAEAAVAWAGINRKNANVGLHLYTYFPKHPEREIETFDFICESETLLALAGVTITVPGFGKDAGPGRDKTAKMKVEIDKIIQAEENLRARMRADLGAYLSPDGIEEVVRMGFSYVMNFLAGLKKILELR